MTTQEHSENLSVCQHQRCQLPVRWGMTEQGFKGFIHEANGLAECPTDETPADDTDATEMDAHNDYATACATAADAQGLTPIMDALTAAGIAHDLKQTGGFCMLVSVPLRRGEYIGISGEGEGHLLVVDYESDEDPEGETLYDGDDVDAAVAAIRRHLDITGPQPTVPPTRAAKRDAVADTVRRVTVEVLAEACPGAPVEAWCGLIDTLALTYGRYLDFRFEKGDAARHNEATCRTQIDGYLSALYALARPWKTTPPFRGELRNVLYTRACETLTEMRLNEAVTS